jgi:hypothetical protein
MQPHVAPASISNKGVKGNFHSLSVNPITSLAALKDGYNNEYEYEHEHEIESITRKDNGIKRRDMFTAMIGSSIAMVAGTLIPSSSQAQQGYLPDMVGGFVKPKGLGGLPKKIRSVGNIMVRFLVTSELQMETESEFTWSLMTLALNSKYNTMSSTLSYLQTCNNYSSFHPYIISSFHRTDC